MFAISGFLLGLFLILFGLTRTEKNFLKSNSPRFKNIHVINKDSFIRTYKIFFSIIGLYLIILGVFLQMNILSNITIYICFIFIFLMPIAIELIIKNKYCKRIGK